MKEIYPVIFTRCEDCYLVEVPDLEILTEGRGLEDAIDMARDAIGLKLITLQDMGKELPNPTSFENVRVENSTFAEEGPGFVSLVDVNLTEYRRKNDNKMVRRNVTLPNWLNREAEAANVNVSRILQEALMQKLGVER